MVGGSIVVWKEAKLFYFPHERGLARLVCIPHSSFSSFQITIASMREQYCTSDTVGEMHISTTPIAHISPAHTPNLLKGISTILGTRGEIIRIRGMDYYGMGDTV
jgi:hypothetical protein